MPGSGAELSLLPESPLLKKTATGQNVCFTAEKESFVSKSLNLGNKK